MYNLIVQLIGIVAMLLCLLCYHFKKRQHLLITKLLADILWALHYILIGGISAFLTNVVCTMRETVYLVDKSEKRRPLQLIFFLALIWCKCQVKMYNFGGLKCTISAGVINVHLIT